VNLNSLYFEMSLTLLKHNTHSTNFLCIYDVSTVNIAWQKCKLNLLMSNKIFKLPIFLQKVAGGNKLMFDVQSNFKMLILSAWQIPFKIKFLTKLVNQIQFSNISTSIGSSIDCHHLTC